MLSQNGYLAIVISNQGGAIGRGLVDYKTIDCLFYTMELDLEGSLKAYYFCPHLIADNCACIKPKPGMLYKAAIEHDIVLEDSWMIGDSESDIYAGMH